MLQDLDRHPLFTAVSDPSSGTTSYLLRNPDGLVQVPPYYATPSFSQDERYLWGYVRRGPTSLDAPPPHPGDALSDLVIADIEHSTYRRTNVGVRFPSAVFNDDRALFFYTRGSSLYSIDITGQYERCWFSLPREVTRHGDTLAFGCHLSISANGLRVALDGRCGLFTFVGYYDLETGEFEVVSSSELKFFDHALYSPTDSHQLFFCHDWFRHPQTDEYHPIDHRVWVVRTDDGQPPRPLIDETEWGQPTHEWWAPDGKSLYAVIHDRSIVKVDITSGVVSPIWQGPHCHGHCDHTQRWFVADQHTYLDIPVSVVLHDSETGTEWPIAIERPPGPKPLNRFYHLDPHPQFSPSGRWITYYSNVRSIADIAVCSLDEVSKETTCYDFETTIAKSL